MGMSVGTGRDDDPMVEMNTTPLIDVMLVLLIMLIVTLPIMTHAVKLDMPRPTDAPPPETVEPVVITVTIDFDGTVLWDGNVVPSMATLESYLRTEAGRFPQPEVHIRPDARAKYDRVAEVLAMAQRNGIERMGLIGNEQFLQ
jgi:biopolymer transport protein ExbD